MTALPSVYLARHGEMAWSRTGQHTGCTDPILKSATLTNEYESKIRESNEMHLTRPAGGRHNPLLKAYLAI